MKTILGVILLILVLNIVGIRDVVRGSKNIATKSFWSIVIIILPVIGLIFYFAIGEKSKRSVAMKGE